MNGKQTQVLRKRLKLTQAQFWNVIGISQSGGSRYERNERTIPKNIELLLTVVHIRKGDATALLAEAARKSEAKRAMRYISQAVFDGYLGCNVRVPGFQSRLFSVARFGSIDNALAAAQLYRDKLVNARG